MSFMTNNLARRYEFSTAALVLRQREEAVWFKNPKGGFMKLKAIIGSLALSFGLSAFAAETPAAPACAKWFNCGSYVMTWNYNDGSEVSKMTTTVTITAHGALAAGFDYVTVSENPKLKPGPINLHVLFEANGTFKMTEQAKDGTTEIYATGICVDKICSYGMHPFPQEDGTMVANAGFISFKDPTKVELFMTFGTPSTNSNTNQVFTKQN
jgi:hypothetical protein